MGVERARARCRRRNGHAAVAAADAHALVAEGGPGDGPAAVDRPDHVVVGHEHVGEEHLVELGVPRWASRSGRTSTPGACMSTTIVVMPACLGTSGSVRTVARPNAGLVGAARPDLLAVAGASRRRPAMASGLHARRVGAGVGLAEQLAPDDLLVERGPHPAGDLVVGAVLDEREDDPAGDAVAGSPDARRDRTPPRSRAARSAPASRPVRLGPVGHGVARVDEPRAVRAVVVQAGEARPRTARTSSRIASASGGRSTARARRVPSRSWAKASHAAAVVVDEAPGCRGRAAGTGGRRAPR